MITGIVNADFEPIIPLSVFGSDGKIYSQDAIVDTGFNGWLSLPTDLIAQLNLKWKRRGEDEPFLGMGVNVYSMSMKQFWFGMESF
jgi:predicted aspartyl protease